jgi:hypothetical protein
MSLTGGEIRVPCGGQLTPEFGIFTSRQIGESIVAINGSADAIAWDEAGTPVTVFDWKSTVSPTAQDVQRHSTQLIQYLAAIGLGSGFLVYATTGQVVEVKRPKAASA